MFDHVYANSEYQHERKLKKLSPKLGKPKFARKLRCSKNILWKKYPNQHTIKRSLFYKVIKKIGIFRKSKNGCLWCLICKDAKQTKKEIM